VTIYIFAHRARRLPAIPGSGKPLGVTAPPTLESVLQRHWGFSRFRPGQREVIEAVVAGRHVLGVMPTGAGKSLCYQLPALMLPGVTLVVSPLIALMKDQVDQLRARGIAAGCLNSTVPLDEQVRLLEDARTGHLKLLYVAPERFRYEGAMARLKRLPISLFAIDEAHCISHWGHDFRPDYQGLGPAYRDLGAPRLAAYTATATSEVRRDIVSSLGMTDPLVTVAGFARDNLHLSVVSIARMKDKPRLAARALEAGLADGGVGIVYCATRKHCEEAVDALRKTRLEVLLYHGGLDDEARRAAQDAFQQGDGVVMVATNAFGMGVDKPNVRVVVHWDFPGSVDAYYQEVGRAGRDGQRAYGVMLFTYADSRIHEFFIDNGGEGLDAKTRAARAAAERKKLKAIQRFAYADGCRHGELLAYFGDVPRRCDLDDPNGARCDRCTDGTGLVLESPRDSSKIKTSREKTRDATPRDDTRETSRDISDEGPRHAPRRLTEDEEIIVQKALSAVARAQGQLDVKTVARALRGSKVPEVLRSPLAGTKSHGILGSLPEATLVGLVKALGKAGCTAGSKPTLTALGTEVMWRRQMVRLAMPPFGEVELAGPPKPADGEDGPDEARLRELKAKRMAVAKERGVPPFVVASNAVLTAIAALPPEAPREHWLAIKGVGEQNVGPLREAFAGVLGASATAPLPPSGA
jgi:ATP-dependent DNA helicase RecQ